MKFTQNAWEIINVMSVWSVQKEIYPTQINLLALGIFKVGGEIVILKNQLAMGTFFLLVIWASRKRATITLSMVVLS